MLRLLRLAAVNVDEVLELVLPSRLELLERDVDDEAPKRALGVLVQLLSTNPDRLRPAELHIACALVDRTCRPQHQHGILLSRRGDDQDAAVPQCLCAIGTGAPVVEKRSSNYVQPGRSADNLRAIAHTGGAAVEIRVWLGAISHAVLLVLLLLGERGQALLLVG